VRALAPILADLEGEPCAVCRGTAREQLLSYDCFGFPVDLVSREVCGFNYCTPRLTTAFMDRSCRHHLLLYRGWSEPGEKYVRAHQLQAATHDCVALYNTLVPRGTLISETTRRKLALTVRLREWCVVRSRAMLLLRYVGLGRWLDLWRLRRACQW